MREVKKWSKDYRTGEVVEKTVFKENESLQGRATIQVFDKDGNVVNETFTENIIHNSFGDMEYYRQIYHSVVGNSFPTVGGGAWSNYYTQFQTILLSTDDEDEGENKHGQWGSIVGYCPRTDTNAGSDTKRGVYNANESWSKVTEDGYMHYHLVYDFGTSQANGTFSSVFWTPTLPNDNRNRLYYPFILRGARNTRSTTLSEAYILRDKDGNFYKSDNNRSSFYRISNMERYLNGIESLKTSPNNEVSTFIKAKMWVGDTGEYVTISDVTQTSGNNWGCTFTINHHGKSGDIKHSLAITDIESLVPDLRQYMDKFSLSGKYFGFDTCHYVAENGDVLLVLYGYCGSGNNSYNCFPTYSSSNNTVNTNTFSSSCKLGGVYNIFTKAWKVTPSFTPQSMGLGVKLSNNANTFNYTTDKFSYEGRTIACSTYNSRSPFYQYNPMTFDVDYITIGDVLVSMNSSTYVAFGCFIPQLKAFYSWYGNSSSYAFSNALAFIVPPSAHTKLPRPVTKTNADTMKVQYDYLVQIPNIFNFDGDYLKMPE